MFDFETTLRKSIVGFIWVLLFVTFFFKQSSAQDSIKPISFLKQNKNNNYISISFGMGVTYSNNPSLVNYIEFDVPNYTFIPNAQKASEFSTGINFFGGVEFQISKTFSIKPEYSYFIKSISIPSNLNYKYSYFTHQPMIMFNYIFSQIHSYIKFGLGGGYFFADFTREEGTFKRDYSSHGVGFKLEGIFNAQIGKSAAAYLSGYLAHSIMSDLKNNNDTYLLNLQNERVNLSSFGVGLRLGIEIFIF